MESYLRLGLLLLAAVLVMMIIFDGWYRRHRMRRALRRQIENPDEILGLESKEPILSTMSSVRPIDNDGTFAASPKLEPAAVAVPVDVVVTKSKPAPSVNDLLVITVAARAGSLFASYDLFQAITATGMEFGEMNIFHYYEPTPKGRTALFSMASATKPGEFDLDKIGDFSCAGLTLFTQLREVPDPQQAFDLMLQTAEQLAEDLDGELRAGQRKPWTADTLMQYQQTVSQF